jgi:hypothetical protein
MEGESGKSQVLIVCPENEVKKGNASRKQKRGFVVVGFREVDSATKGKKQSERRRFNP